VFISASTDCFPDTPLSDALQRLVDLEYTTVELAIHERGGALTPSQVHADLDKAIERCRATQRLTVTALAIDITAEGDEYFGQFASCCKLAKAIKVVAVAVPGAELGTPFNAEIERLQEMVAIASFEGVVVGVKTEAGRVTQDPDTAVVMCDNVKGLGITLDPSHLVCGPHQGGNFDQLMKYVIHVQLRDTTKEKFQVRVGQGEIEYGRLVAQLVKAGYDRALSVDMVPMEGVDHGAELRKIRLLLDSLL